MLQVLIKFVSGKYEVMNFSDFSHLNEYVAKPKVEQFEILTENGVDKRRG